MRCDQANNIPAHLYLEKKGFHPSHTRLNGRELWYISPIRAQEKTPSFKVDVILNRWFDHGLGKGGKTVDLAIEICRCSVRDALSDIERSNLLNNASRPQTIKLLPDSMNGGENVPAFEKEKIQNGSLAFRLLDETNVKHPALLNYLNQRKISQQIVLTQPNLSEIHFKPANSDKRFFALGWKSGKGHEARNSRFKGFVGVGKGITYLKTPNAALCVVFEGFMDYLSYLSEAKIEKPNFSVITLNTGHLKMKALPHLINDGYKIVQLFMDNDKLGDECVDFFQTSLKSVQVEDMRSAYANYKDYNEMVVSK